MRWLLVVVSLLGSIVGLSLAVHWHAQPDIDVLGLGHAFEGTLQLPAKTIQSAFEAAREHMFSANGDGRVLHALAVAAAIISTCTGALIALTVAVLRPRGEGPQPPASLEGLSKRAAVLVSVAATIGTICSGAGHALETKSQACFKHAEALRDLITHARAQITSASKADEASAILDDLKLQTER